MGDTDLHRAARYGDLEETKRLVLRQKEDVNGYGYALQTSLHEAMLGFHLEVVKFLMEQDADIGALDDRDRTPLFYAAKKGFLEGIKYVVTNGMVNLDAQDKLGHTMLHIACIHWQIHVVRFLLEHGASPLVADPIGRTPLHIIVKDAHVGVMKLLLDHGADIHATTKPGQTPLHMLVSAGPVHVDAVKLLLDRGANPLSTNNQGDTPLHMVKTKVMAACLVENSKVPPAVVLAARNKSGQTPLEKAEKTALTMMKQLRHKDLHREMLEMIVYLESWDSTRLAVPSWNSRSRWDLGVMMNPDLSKNQKQRADEMNELLQQTTVHHLSIAILGYLVPSDLLKGNENSEVTVI